MVKLAKTAPVSVFSETFPRLCGMAQSTTDQASHSKWYLEQIAVELNSMERKYLGTSGEAK